MEWAYGVVRLLVEFWLADSQHDFKFQRKSFIEGMIYTSLQIRTIL